MQKLYPKPTRSKLSHCPVPGALLTALHACTVKLTFPGENGLPMISWHWEGRENLEQGATGDGPSGLQQELPADGLAGVGTYIFHFQSLTENSYDGRFPSMDYVCLIMNQGKTPYIAVGGAHCPASDFDTTCQQKRWNTSPTALP